MGRKRSRGKVTFFRVHRERGYGPPRDHIPVHVVVRLDDDSPLELGFPLAEDENRLVHEAWVAMLRDAFSHRLTVEILSDHDTEEGNNGVIRDLVLTR